MKSISELQNIVEQIGYVRKQLNGLLTLNNLYLISKIINTQFLAPRVPKLFDSYRQSGDVFIYSCADDPNLCQLSLHKGWQTVLFAWVREDAIYLFRFSKQDLGRFGLQINHADAEMISSNRLFKQSVRLSEEDIQQLSEFLVEIIANTGE